MCRIFDIGDGVSHYYSEHNTMKGFWSSKIVWQWIMKGFWSSKIVWQWIFRLIVKVEETIKEAEKRVLEKR